MSMHDTSQLANRIHFCSKSTSLFLQRIMSMHDTSRLVNVYRCSLSLRTSVFHTYVLIGVYFRRVPSLFVGHGVVAIKLATRAIGGVSW
jgi:hypothetical protein